MKKTIYFSLFLGICNFTNSAFGQSNDEKAIQFLDTHLQTMFKVLNSKPETISSTCMDSLKKLHNFKQKVSKDLNSLNDIDIAILRAFYVNSIQFCETDVQTICSKRTELSIRKTCKDLSEKNP